LFWDGFPNDILLLLITCRYQTSSAQLNFCIKTTVKRWLFAATVSGIAYVFGFYFIHFFSVGRQEGHLACVDMLIKKIMKFYSPKFYGKIFIS